ncbi:MAG: putative glycosyl hydrolase [Phycisphaerales bacterium]|nr:putative glycosyl hydrolase [Phycisphaerales bacterium]
MAILGIIGAAAPSTSTALPSFAVRGRMTQALIDRTLAGKGQQAGFYMDEARPKEPGFKSHPAFAWGAGVQLSALNAAANIDPAANRAAMLRYVRAIDTHWFVYNGIGGFCAADHPNQPDRYYDDNAWLVLDFLEGYELTGDKTLLKRARDTMKFILSGEDDKLGGGIYWHEQRKESKHTCINAPAAVCALRLYQITGEKSYLAIGQRLYDWTKAKLQDPADGLYADNVKLNGKVDNTKFSYNSALMIRAACLLFDVTSDKAYLTEATRVATASEAKWCKPSGAMGGPGYFAHLLAEAFLEVGHRDHDPRWAQLVSKTCDFLWQKNQDPNGYFPEHWDTVPTAPLEKIVLMPNASVVRMFFRMEAEKAAKH